MGKVLVGELHRKATVRMPQVRDSMTSDVVTVEPSTGIVQKAQRMIQQEKGPLPVVERGPDGGHHLRGGPSGPTRAPWAELSQS